MNNKLIALDDNISEELIAQSQIIMDTMMGYKELMMMYGCAIKVVETKLNNLDMEYNVRYKRNPIKSIKSRVKQIVSIVEKLDRLNKPCSVESIEKNLNDVAGVRVVCSFVDDIYAIAEALINQSDVTLICKKDYIEKPKANGYRSLHLVITVPVYFANQVKDVRVEVQIRTIAMDFWASVEHQLKYKQHVANEDEIVEELRKCAEVIAKTDNRMLAIRNDIEKNSSKPTAEEELIEKLKRFDHPLGK